VFSNFIFKSRVDDETLVRLKFVPNAVDYGFYIEILNLFNGLDFYLETAGKIAGFCGSVIFDRP